MDPETAHTLQFVATSIAASAAKQRILEIGCGDGRLARALEERGHEVTPLIAARPRPGGPADQRPLPRRTVRTGSPTYSPPIASEL